MSIKTDGIWRPELALNKKWICVRHLIEGRSVIVVRDIRQHPPRKIVYFGSKAKAQRECDRLNGQHTGKPYVQRPEGPAK